MVRTRPLFTLDPGWLFLLAGLAVFVSVVLIPAERDVHDLRDRLASLRAEEQFAYDRLGAYAEFLDRLEDPDPALLRRLGASQLNLLPSGERSLLVSSSHIDTVTDWIDQSIIRQAWESRPLPETLLRQLATGHMRVWLLGAAVLCMFIGLLMTPTMFQRANRRGDAPAEPWEPDAAETDGEAIDESDEEAPADHLAESDEEWDDSTEDEDDCDAEYAERAEFVRPVTPGGQALFRWGDVDPKAPSAESSEQGCDHGSAAPEEGCHPSDESSLDQRQFAFSRKQWAIEVETKPADDVVDEADGPGSISKSVSAQAAAARTKTQAHAREILKCIEHADAVEVKDRVEPDTPSKHVDQATSSDEATPSAASKTNRKKSSSATSARSTSKQQKTTSSAKAKSKSRSPSRRKVSEGKAAVAMPDQSSQSSETQEECYWQEVIDDSVNENTNIARNADDTPTHDEKSERCAPADSYVETKTDTETETYADDADEEDFEYEYEYYDEDGNPIDPADFDAEEWEFVDEEGEEEEEDDSDDEHDDARHR